MIEPLPTIKVGDIIRDRDYPDGRAIVKAIMLPRGYHVNRCCNEYLIGRDRAVLVRKGNRKDYGQ